MDSYHIHIVLTMKVNDDWFGNFTLFFLRFFFFFFSASPPHSSHSSGKSTHSKTWKPLQDHSATKTKQNHREKKKTPPDTRWLSPDVFQIMHTSLLPCK
jgi:hypothetical protein